MAAQRRIELSALRAENEALRATLGGRMVGGGGRHRAAETAARPQAPAPSWS